MTEGAELAFFDVDPDRASAVVDCIEQHVAQGHVAAAPWR
jgi:hypothetical protein